MQEVASCDVLILEAFLQGFSCNTLGSFLKTYLSESMNRRHMLKLGTIGTLMVASPALWLWRNQAAYAATSPPILDPEMALQRLLAGNRRFAQHNPDYPHQSQQRVQEVAQAQHPFAVILSCADSRVPAEIIFDQGIGDIFDVRIAGNIATPEAIGSLEYAVALLETPLLMVLGHERCGAVTAAVQNKPLPGDIGSFVKAILPAVDQVKAQPGDMVENVVTANVRYQFSSCSDRHCCKTA